MPRLANWRMSIGIILFLSMIPQPAFASPNVAPGEICPKVNMQKELGGRLFTCVKVGSKLRWNKGVQLTSPTPTAPAESPVSSLAVTPIVALEGLGTLGVNARTYIDGKNFIAGNRYFLVINAPNGLDFACGSGDVVIPSVRDMSNVRILSERSKGLLNFTRVGIFEITPYPITISCKLQSAAAYDFAIYQTPIDNLYKITAISPVTRVLNANYVSPSPKPSSTSTTSAELIVREGQSCAPEGAIAKANDGSLLRCKKETSSDTLRWSK